jgi:hypothetical protein
MARPTKAELNTELGLLAAKFASKLVELTTASSTNNAPKVKRLLALLDATYKVAESSVTNMQNLSSIQGVGGDHLMDFAYRSIQRMNKEFDNQVEKTNKELEAAIEAENKSKEVAGKVSRAATVANTGAVVGTVPVVFNPAGTLMLNQGTAEGAAAQAAETSKAAAQMTQSAGLIDNCRNVGNMPSQLSGVFDAFDAPEPDPGTVNFGNDVFDF